MLFRSRWVFGAVGVCLLGATASSQTRSIPLSEFRAMQPEDIKPTGTSTQTVLFGDPNKPGLYVVQITFKAGSGSRPHFHDQDRLVTVVKGTWWIATGNHWDKDKMLPMPMGSHVTHFGGQVHWDGAKDEEAWVLIVGEGPEAERLQARIVEHNLTSQIRMLGFRDDLLNIFRSLDLFVIPSVEGDTIPQVLMQALAMGLPVVSTTTGSIPDVVQDGVTGYVVPPRDADALADRIVALLGDPGLRMDMGRRGRAMVERDYSLSRMLDRLEDVYRKVARA